MKGGREGGREGGRVARGRTDARCVPRLAAAARSNTGNCNSSSSSRCTGCRRAGSAHFSGRRGQTTLRTTFYSTASTDVAAAALPQPQPPVQLPFFTEPQLLLPMPTRPPTVYAAAAAAVASEPSVSGRPSIIRIDCILFWQRRVVLFGPSATGSTVVLLVRLCSAVETLERAIR